MMTDEHLKAHLDRWAEGFEDRLKRRGSPVIRKHETTGSVKRADKKESDWVRSTKRGGESAPTCHPNRPAVTLDGVVMDYCQQCYEEATEILEVEDGCDEGSV